MGWVASLRIKGLHPPHLYLTLTSQINQKYNYFNENLEVFGSRNLLHQYFMI